MHVGFSGNRPHTAVLSVEGTICNNNQNLGEREEPACLPLQLWTKVLKLWFDLPSAGSLTAPQPPHVLQV